MSFLIRQTLIYAVPLMIVALAGVFAERSGIINLALEGIMIFGAFMGVMAVRLIQQWGWFQAAYDAGNWMALQGFALLVMVISAILGALFAMLMKSLLGSRAKKAAAPSEPVKAEAGKEKVAQ